MNPIKKTAKKAGKLIKKSKKEVKQETPDSSECTSGVETSIESDTTETTTSFAPSESNSAQELSEAFVVDLEQLARTDIRQTIQKDINEKYALSSFAGHEIPICKMTGRLNLAAICKIGGKELTDYKANSRSKKIIGAVTAKLAADLAANEGPRNLGPSQNDPRILGSFEAISKPELAGPKIVRGTYGHALIAIDVAVWCSPEFGLEVYTIALESFAKAAAAKHMAVIAQQRDRIDELLLQVKKNEEKRQAERKADRIAAKKERKAARVEAEKAAAKAEARYRRQKARSKAEAAEAKARFDELVGHSLNIRDQNDDLKEDVADLQEDVTDVKAKLVVSRKTRVMPLDEASKHSFIGFRNQGAPGAKWRGSPWNSKINRAYTTKRVMKSSEATAIANHKSKYPNAVEIIRFQDCPNPVRILKTYKAKYGSKIECYGTSFDLKDDYTEDQMIRHFHKIYQARMLD